MRIVFVYLGRRGSLGQFTLELAQAASSMLGKDATFVTSSSNQLSPPSHGSEAKLVTLDTFERATPIAVLGGFLRTRRRLLALLDAEKPAALINLMPHVWTPLMVRAVQRRGVKFVSIIHDAVGHPGDPTGPLIRWFRQEARQSDLTVTLSHAVARQLQQLGTCAPQQLLALFHPDLHFGTAVPNRKRTPNQPLRLLFLGRIMKYKGLDLLVEAVEMLKREGVPLQLGVAGSGDISDLRDRLRALDAEVVNRWLEEAEIGRLLARYDAMALSHVEASQSGVAATAFGACMPVVAMPVGGNVEQVIEGETGILSTHVTARSYADAIRRLCLDEPLYERISTNIASNAQARSMESFLGRLVGGVSSLPRTSR